MDRKEARGIILRIAADQRRRTNIRMANAWPAGRNSPLLSPLPKLQEAVCIVRRHGLVPNDLLAIAGFRPGTHPDRPADRDAEVAA